MFKWSSGEDGDFNEDLSFTLIKDTIEKSGRLVLKATAVGLFEQHDVSCICYELPVSVFSEGLESQHSTSFSFVDAFSDPLAWKNPASPRNCFSPEFLSEFENEQALVIDSLSAYLVHNSVQSLYRSIYNRLISGCAPVCGLLHADVHSSEDCAMLESLASTVINVIPDSKSEKDFCQVIIRRRNKRPLVRIFTYASNSSLLDDFKFKEFKHPDGNKAESKSNDPAANLTFNLKLTDSEKKSRSEVPLPYVISPETGGEKTDQVNSDNENCAEYLEEEEDPDDDLDF